MQGECRCWKYPIAAAVIHRQHQIIPHPHPHPHHQTIAFTSYSCGNRLRTRKDTSNQARAFPHTSQKTPPLNIAILEAGQNCLTALVQDLLAVCVSIPYTTNFQNRRGGPTTADLMPSHRIRWMTEASFQPQGGLLTQQQEALLPRWAASIQCRAASLQ